MPHGLLKHFDLPDCYRALSKKSLKIIAPWTSQMKVWKKKVLPAHVRARGIDTKIVKMQ